MKINAAVIPDTIRYDQDHASRLVISLAAPELEATPGDRGGRHGTHFTAMAPDAQFREGRQESTLSET